MCEEFESITHKGEWFLRHGWGHRDKHGFCFCVKESEENEDVMDESETS